MPRQAQGRRSVARNEEQRQAKLQAILGAALEVFSEKGFADARLDDVAARAGVTKGALYWNFPSKQELFFALLDERVDSRVRSLLEQFEAASSEEDPAAAVSRGVADVVDDERQLVLLMQEYWSLAARDPELRGRYVERQRMLRRLVAHTVEARHATTGVPLTTSPDRLATGIAALTYGLAIERVADPDTVPDDLLGELIDLLYDGLTVRAGAARS